MLASFLATAIAVLNPPPPTAAGEATLLNSLFSTSIRTPYCSYDPLRRGYSAALWLEDRVYPVGDYRLILRYTTDDSRNPSFAVPDGPTGNMSVYVGVGAQVLVLAEYSIRSNERGEPTKILGIQEYIPHKLFGERPLPRTSGTVWYETSGSFAYCQNNVAELCVPKLVPGSHYEYSVGIQTDENTPSVFWVHENYIQHTDTTYDVYARSFVYETLNTTNPLLAAIDYTTGKAYYRFSYVDSNGECQNND